MSKRSAPKLLIITPDVVGKKMAGPGMRYVAIAKALAPSMPVTFAIGIEGSQIYDFGNLDISTKKYSHVDELMKLIDDCDVIFCQFVDTNAVNYALTKGKKVVYDLYNALPIETVGAEKISGYTTTLDKDREYTELLRYFKFCSQTGTYFVTSNERQRDWWLGFIMANRGILPSNLNKRKMDDIIGLVPFGMEEQEPNPKAHGLRGSHDIRDDDFVLIWGGGIWDWFDAETPIKAVAELAKDDPRIKIVFYGTVHPNSAVGKPKAVDRAQKLAKDLGVFGTQVVFHDGWIPADERVNYLADADAAVSSHVESLETHYAFRTRILDHFWVKLPSLVTEGDWFADYIKKNDLGVITPCLDLESTKAAILTLQKDSERSRIVKNITRVRENWRWSQTTSDLRNFLLNDLDTSPQLTPPSTDDTPPAPTLAGYLKQTKVIMKLKTTPVWPYVRKAKRIIKR
ncbi:hypothetical protein EON76_01485 [bacterium]|nr:MAG: hypothetical protein EON76_01485 [bacterium]